MMTIPLIASSTKFSSVASSKTVSSKTTSSTVQKPISTLPAIPSLSRQKGN